MIFVSETVTQTRLANLQGSYWSTEDLNIWFILFILSFNVL